MSRTLPIVVLALVLVLAGCGGDDADPTPTTAPTPAGTPPTPAGPATAVVAPTRAAATRNGQLVGDGVCQTRVPLTWSEDAPGTGTTAGGHRFTIFGNALTAEGAWETAITLLKDQSARQPDAQVMEGEAYVRITYADSRGFAYRARFGDLYCDVRVNARGSPISETERATWDAIIESLEPVT